MGVPRKPVLLSTTTKRILTAGLALCVPGAAALTITQSAAPELPELVSGVLSIVTLIVHAVLTPLLSRWFAGRQ